MAANPIIYCLEHLTDYRQFERLCTDIMSQSGFPDIELLGGSNDGGRDAIHVSRQNPHDVTLFAYSVRPDWEKKLLKEDCKRIFEEKHQLQRLVFACTSRIIATKRDSVKRAVWDEFGWALDLCDLERLRTRLSGELRHLIAQHSSIFTPPFFPTRGGLSVSECRDTIIIDHHLGEHALATWIARQLLLAGHRVWCYGTAPLAGETADESIRLLISQRGLRYLPILSAASMADADFVGRCAVAAGVDDLVLPCVTAFVDKARLPSKTQRLECVDFSQSWASGLKGVIDVLEAQGIKPVLSSDQGRAIALQSYVPQSVTMALPERLYANTFPVTVPAGIVVCELSRDLSDAEKATLRRNWAFVEANAHTLLAFDNPPETVPLVEGVRLAAYDWRHYESKFGKRSTHVVKELIRRSLDVACAAIGLDWCGDRKKFYFPTNGKQNRFLSYTHVDGRKTRVAVTGEKTFGSGDGATPFSYQLGPTFGVGQDEAGAWWATMRIYVRITDTTGIPHQLKAISRRRKKVTKAWWNQEWFARTLAIIQALGAGGTEIAIGSGGGRVVVSTIPLSWDCPVAIDYHAVEMIGDFQEEMASLRYLDDETDEDDEEADG